MMHLMCRSVAGCKRHDSTIAHDLPEFAGHLNLIDQAISDF